MPLFDLTGKTAIVTGAAQGLGKATAIALAQHGAEVLLVDRNFNLLMQTVEEIAKLGAQVKHSVCDLSDIAQIDQLFASVDHQWEHVDFLANVAGDGVLASPEHISQETIHQVFQSLVFGRFAMCQAAGQRMLAAGNGSIVNIGSLASTTALGRGHIAYSMAMGAVVQMTRELSLEWGSKGVRVNAILPAQVMNPSIEERLRKTPELKDQWLSGIPAGRLGVPQDIQGLMVLLASDASSWINGALIPLDGGNLAMNAGGSIGFSS